MNNLGVETNPGSMQGGGSALRLFVAIPMPQEILSLLADLSTRLQKGIRFTPCKPAWVSPSTMHLTLRFFGMIDEIKIKPLADSLSQTIGDVSSFDLRLGGLGVFPDWRRPRVLWTGATEPTGALERLQGKIEELAIQIGCQPERAQWKPHLTLARFRSTRGVAAARGVVLSHRDFKTGKFRAEEAVLYSSSPTPSGARHDPVRRCPFVATVDRPSPEKNAPV